MIPVIKKLTLDEAFGILRALGCENDPVVHKGKDTDLDQLENDVDLTPARMASDVRVGYWTGDGRGRKSGTLQSMVVNRLRREP